MRLSQNHVAVIALVALLASGCKRHPAEPATVETTNAVPVATNAPTPPPVPSRTRDLGVLQLTNRIETRLQLGNGKSCTITPQMLDHDRLKLTLVLESKQTNGVPGNLKIMSVMTHTNQQFEVDFGTLDLTLTPQVVVETNPPSKTH